MHRGNEFISYDWEGPGSWCMSARGLVAIIFFTSSFLLVFCVVFQSSLSQTHCAKPPAMAKKLEVLYNQELEYYLCRKCHTHICLLRDCADVHRVFKTVHTANPDNVVIDATPENRIMLGGHILAVVQCSGCHKELGRKCIEEGNHSNYLCDYEEGKFGLNLKSLLFWDGNQMLEAKTLQPWDGNNLEEWERELNEDDLT